MARRRQMRIDPSVFLQQQGGDDRDQLAMAMEMLGFGKGQEGRRGELQLGREQLQEQAGYHGRGQDIEEKKLAAETERTAAQEAFNNWMKEQTLKGQEEERKYRVDVLTGKAQESRDTLNAKLYELASPEEKKALLGEMSPEAQRGVLKMQAATQSAAAKTLLPTVRAAYEKGDVGLIKQLTQDVAPEILQRPEFDWEKWNQGLATAPKGITGGNRGLLGLLWNTPAAMQNVGKGIANVVSSGVMGESAPQAEYTKFTDPIQKLQERATGMQKGPVVSEAPLASLTKLLSPSNILGLDRRGPTVDQLLQTVTPPVSGMVPSEAVFGTRYSPTVESQTPTEPTVPQVSAVGQGAAWQHQIPQTAGVRRPEEATYSLAPQISAVQPGEYEPGAGFPRQPVTGPAPTGPQWTVQDLLSKLVMDQSEQQRLPWTYGPWTPPTGEGLPPPVGGPIDPRLLGQPTSVFGSR